MPKKIKKAISFEEAEILRKENAQLRIENIAFSRLLRSTHNHYEGLEITASELAASIKAAKRDATNLLELLDKREARKKAIEEQGVHGEGTG